MRPKSIATVVSGLRERVSSLIARSVESTVISLIVRISVVLPAENGPVTTIFTAVPCCFFLGGIRSQPSHTCDQPEEQALVDARVAFDDRAGVRRTTGRGRSGGTAR